MLSPFGPSIRARRGGLLGRLAAIMGPLGSLWGRPRAPLSLSETLLEAPQAYEELTRLPGVYASLRDLTQNLRELTRSLRGLGHPKTPRSPPRQPSDASKLRGAYALTRSLREAYASLRGRVRSKPMENHSCFPRLDRPLPECCGFPVWTVYL